MAFPTVTARATSVDDVGTTTTHAVTLPTHSAGQMLVVVCGSNNGGDGFRKVSGWNLEGWMFKGATGDSTTSSVYWKIAESSSETFSAVTGGNRKTAHVAFAISGANRLDAIGNGNTTAAANTSSLVLTEDAARDYLWITSTSLAAQTVASAAPTNYSNLTTIAGGTGNCGVSTAERTLNASSEDPGAFTHSSQRYANHTLAIWEDTDASVVRKKWRWEGAINQGDDLQGWSFTNVGDVPDFASTNPSDFAAYTNGDHLRGLLYVGNFTAGDSQDGYWQWSGTFEDLGVPSGTTVTGYSFASLTYGVENYPTTGNLALADADGSGAAFEINDGTSRVLIANQSDPGSGGFATRVNNSPAISGLSLASTTSVTLRLHVSYDNTTGFSSIQHDKVILDITTLQSGGDYASTTAGTSTVSGNLNIARNMVAAPAATSTVAADLNNPFVRYASTVAATSTVTPALTVRDITPDFASVVSATSTVTGNIDESKRFLGSVVGQLVLGPTPNLAVARPLISTTTAASIVTGNIISGVQYNTTVAATSTVTPSLAVSRPIASTTNATSTVVSDFRSITPQFASTTTAAATITPSLSLGKPFIAAKQTSTNETPSTSYTVPLPTHRAGQMLVVFVAHGDNVASSWDTITSTAGWRNERVISLAGTDTGLQIAFKIADSSSEVITLETTAAEKWYTCAYAIDDANGYFIRSHNNGLFSATTNPEFRPITMNKARDIISFAAVAGEADSIMTVAPTGYTIDETIQGGVSFNDGSLSIATQETNTTTQTPSTPTMQNNAAHCTMHFIVYNRAASEQDFEFRASFNDTTSYFDTQFDDPRIIDNNWKAFDANQTIDNTAWAYATGGPSGSALFDDAFATMRHGTGTATEDGFVEYETTWEQLGLPATTSITGYDPAELWYEITGITDQSVRPGTSTNGALEIVDPNGTHVLIPAPTAHTANTSWIQLTGNEIKNFTPYLATETIKFRIYGERFGGSAGFVELRFEDLRIPITVADNLSEFSIAGQPEQFSNWSGLTSGLSSAGSPYTRSIAVETDPSYTSKTGKYLASFITGWNSTQAILGTANSSDPRVLGFGSLILWPWEMVQEEEVGGFVEVGGEYIGGGLGNIGVSYSWVYNVNDVLLLDFDTDVSTGTFVRNTTRNDYKVGASIPIVTYSSIDTNSIPTLSVPTLTQQVTSDLTRTIDSSRQHDALFDEIPSDGLLDSYTLTASPAPPSASVGLLALEGGDGAIPVKSTVTANLNNSRDFAATVSATSTVSAELVNRTFSASLAATSSASGSLRVDLLGFDNDEPARGSSLSPTGNYYAIVVSDNQTEMRTYVWDFDTNERIAAIPQLVAHYAATVRFSNDGTLLAIGGLNISTGTTDGFKVLNVPGFTEVAGTPTFSGVFGVNAIAFNSDSSLCAISVGDGSGQTQLPGEGIFVYNTSDWTLAQTVQTTLPVVDNSMNFSRDDAYLSFLSTGNNVYIYETTTWTQEIVVAPATVTSAPVWGDTHLAMGTTVNLGGGATGWLMYEIGTWSATAGPNVLGAISPTPTIVSLSFLPDGDRILLSRANSTGSGDDILVFNSSDANPANWTLDRSIDRFGYTPRFGLLDTYQGTEGDYYLVAGKDFINYAEFDLFELNEFSSNLRVVVSATSTVTSNAFNRSVPLASTVAATSAVTGNIDPTRKLISTTVAQSVLGPNPSLDVARPLVSTTTATSLVTANVGLTVFFAGQTDAVAVVSPNEFFYGYESVISATSTVTATLDVNRPINTSIAATSALDPTAIERTVNWNSVTSVASSVFVQPFERAAALRTFLNGNQVLEANMRLAGKFASVISVTSAVTPTLDRQPGFISTTNAVSTVTAATGRGIPIVAAVVAQTVLGPNPSLAVFRTIDTALAATSTLTVQPIARLIEWQTLLNVTSTVIGTVVVITNTLELTWTETYFYEPEPYILRLKTDTYNDTTIVNEIIDPIQVQDEEVLSPMIVNYDDDGPA